MATVVKYNGGWSNQVRNMGTNEALSWMSKHGYKAVKAHDIKHDVGNGEKIELVVIGRQILFQKPGVKTEYNVTIIF